jgi:hypothetical protein
MLIRREQIDAMRAALSNSRVAEFEQRQLSHLREHFANLLQGESDEEVLARIRSDLDDARSHGLRLWSSWSTFIDLSLVLGAGFAREPELPWAQEILESAGEDEPARMARLRSAALGQLQQRLDDAGS